MCGREVISVFTFALVLAGVVALSALVALAALVISVQVTDRHRSLRNPSYSRTDAIARRILGVYADRPVVRARDERDVDHYDHAGR
jgi:hypothetical protein